MTWIKEHKAYVIIGVFAVLAVLVFGVKMVIPEFVFAILGALGVGTIRVVIQTLSKNKGWKTYGAVIATIVIAVLQAIGLVLPYATIYTVLGAVGIVGVADAVEKLKSLF